MLELLVANMPYLLLAAGLFLVALEALSPGAHLIVVGVALVGAGLFGLVLGPFLGGTVLLLVLAALTLAIGSVATWIYREFDFYGGKGTAQTRDSDALSGRVGYVTETVTPRGGQVKLEDGGFSPFYSARAQEGTIEEGEKVLVLDPGGGNVLTVESYDVLEEDEIDRELAREAAKRSAEIEEGESASGTDAGGEETERKETETERSGA
ncbi:NfeD family protein [Natronobiforma cellulositropha]|uniref:NfeD family protein n=1 Tax=Natronobiforma cellulositropha TaxID=1679076 RepID=UPI0021D5AB58|nr:NfeD family protein [Natronobiforma cellulositropha]